MKVILFFIYCLLCNNAKANGKFHTPPTDTLLTASLLWEISGNGLQKPSYLFGTIHTFCKGDISFSTELKKIIQASEKTFFESFDTVSSGNRRPFNNISYANTLSKKYFKKLTNILKLKPLNKTETDSILELPPFLLVQRLKKILLNCPLTSAEREIYDLSKPLNINISGLETGDEHSAVADSADLKEQIKYLKRFLDQSPDFQYSYQREIDNYVSEDINLMADNKTNQILAKVFVDDRNLKWLSIIIGQIHSQSTFIAVGAGHLGGKNGLVNLLKKAGYTLKPVL